MAEVGVRFATGNNGFSSRRPADAAPGSKFDNFDAELLGNPPLKP